MASSTNNSGFLLTIGDIGVTSDTVVTPNGCGPLAGSTWICSDQTRTESKIPTWAIVMAIIFALFCLIGLLFLLVKENTMRGYVEVTVRTGAIFHKVQIPVSSDAQVMWVRQQINQALALSQRASAQ